MASTYTPAGIELITTGEQSGTWGSTTNTNLELIEELATGVVGVPLTSTTYTLTTSDGVSSVGRHAVVVFSGTPGGTCTVTVSPNDMQKLYFVKNGSNQTVTLTQGSGSDVSIAAGDSAIVYCDGAGAGAAVVDFTSTFNFAAYADTTANFTGTLQNGGSNVVVDSDIGSTVQAYDADTAKYDDTTANFTGTLQNGGSNVVVDSDIGSTVQAYDADLTALGGLAKTDGNFIVGNGSTWVAESGATARTSLGAGAVGTNLFTAATAAAAQQAMDTEVGVDVQAYDADLTALGGLAKTDGNFIVGNGTTWVAESGATARTSLGLGSLATANSVNASTIDDNSVGAAELNVSGNGTTSQYLRSDGDGTFTWATPTNTTYSTATSTVAGLVELFSDTDQSVAANAVTATAGRTYGIQLNSSDQMVVNVPWTDTNTTYSTATNSTLGLVKLFDNTDQSVAANAVTTTASRTYGIQLNSSDQMVVNVPWTDTDTTYSAGTGVTLAGTTFSIGQAVATSSDVQFDSFGVGTAASGTTGEIRATNNITAYYSDARLKDFEGKIDNAVAKVMALNGYYFTENETAKTLGYNNDKRQVGVSAQEVQAVLPEVVTDAPINGNFEGADYITVYYDKLVPLLIEAIKEQQGQINALKAAFESCSK